MRPESLSVHLGIPLNLPSASLSSRNGNYQKKKTVLSVAKTLFLFFVIFMNMLQNSTAALHIRVLGRVEHIIEFKVKLAQEREMSKPILLTIGQKITKKNPNHKIISPSVYFIWPESPALAVTLLLCYWA